MSSLGRSSCRSAVYREKPDIPDDVWREVALLAHEFGHHVSHMQGWRSGPYFEANQRMANGCLHLSEDEVALILREECIAWQIGAMLLEGCGVVVPAFEEYKRSGLRAYCKWMLVTEASADIIDRIVADQLAA